MCREKGTNVPRKGNDGFQKIGDFWYNYAIFSKNLISIRLFKSYMRCAHLKGARAQKRNEIKWRGIYQNFTKNKRTPISYFEREFFERKKIIRPCL